ncbi:MAG: hypothetical protein ACOYXA_13795 [Bacteroidota bacterium]
MPVLFAIIATLGLQLGLSFYCFHLQRVKNSSGKFQWARLHF